MIGPDSRVPPAPDLRDASLITEPELVAAIVDHMTHIGITLDDIESLLLNRHGLAAYCPACGRWADLDLAALVRQGHGRRRLVGFKPPYCACGGPGQVM